MTSFPRRVAAALTSPRSVWWLVVVAILLFAGTWAFTTLSYFFADDYLLADVLIKNPLNVEILTRSWFGHLLPGYIAVDGVFMKLLGLNWAAAGAVIALVHTGVYVALVRCLDAAVGRVRMNLLFGLAFTLSTGVFVTRLWWAATLNNMLALAFCLAMMGSLTRWVTRKRWWYLAGTLIAFALALSMSEKSLLFAAFAVLWVLLVVWRDEKIARRLLLLVKAWPVWLGMAVLGGIVVWVFVHGAYVDESGEAASLSTSALFVGWGIVGGFVPSLFGLDLWQTRPAWEFAAIVASNAVLLAAIVVSIVRRRSVGGVWIFIALAALATTGVLSRRADLLGIDGSRILRYDLEETALFWMAAGVIAFSVLAGRVRRVSVPAVVGGAGVSVAGSTSASEPALVGATATSGAASTVVPAARHARAGGPVAPASVLESDPESVSEDVAPPSRARVVGGWIALVTVAVVTAASIAVWIPTTLQIVKLNNGVDTRIWVDRLDETFPTGEVPPFLDTTVPTYVAITGMAPFNTTGIILPLIHPGTPTTDELGGAWIVGADGTAGPAVVQPLGPEITVGQCTADSGISIPGLAGAAGDYVVLDFSKTTPNEVSIQVGHLVQRTITSTSGQLVVQLAQPLEAGTFAITNNGKPICVDSAQVVSIAPGAGR
ncbi:hypothetical protein [Herbiconiux solani]|uniref:hypothetical protein n=1 Tax=Herbiconiux solani TaxID=661329 RepID=UPI0008245DF2|nr:hypothetical protein [Herbiconiux solani]